MDGKAGPPLTATLQVAGARDAGAELKSLHEWLAQEPELRGAVRAEAPDEPPGTMGAVADVLIVALGSGGAVTVLLQSLNAWVQSRRPEISVDITQPDGSVVKITAGGTAAESLAKKLKPT